MPVIFLKYARYPWRYTYDVRELCDIPAICLRYICDFPDIGLEYTRYLTDICLGFTRNICEICEIYAYDICEMCMIYHLTWLIDKIFVSCEWVNKWMSSRFGSRDANTSEAAVLCMSKNTGLTTSNSTPQLMTSNALLPTSSHVLQSRKGSVQQSMSSNAPLLMRLSALVP